jgi:hypothetical protein
MAVPKHYRIKGVTITDAAGSSGQGDAANGAAAVLSLVYAGGQRPSLEALAELSLRDPISLRFTISHVPSGDAAWAELLAGGLTYDCRGLAPGDPAPQPGRGTMLGLPDIPAGEAISLEPAPHLAEGRGMLPVVRVLAGVGAELAQLPGLNGVFWQPAQCWMAPKYFRGVMAEWLGGGSFPSLGLTALQRQNDGAMLSVGLDFLIGQELRFEPDRRLVPAAVARIAMRLIHSLIESGPLTESADFTGPDGERLSLEPIRGGRQLRVVVRR